MHWLTAAYSKYQFPAGFKKNALFIKINSIITAFWVIVFITQAAISTAAAAALSYRVVWMAACYLLLIPAFIFTSRFPNWYITRRGAA